MDILKVLISHNKLPHIHDLMTIQCKNICSELEQKFILKIIWTIFPSEENISITNNESIIDASKFNNAIDILKNASPDLIIINGSLDFHNITIAIAAKYLNIPLVVIFLRNIPQRDVISTRKSINSRLRRGFTVPSFYLNQYSFLLRTLGKTDHNILEKFTFIFSYTKKIFLMYFPVDKMIEGDLNLCRDEKWEKTLLDHGFDRSKIFVVGDTYFDSIFDKIRNLDIKTIDNTQKIKILFCTTTMFGHGLCSKEEESDLIVNIINEILKQNDFEICLKIHPSTASIEYYEKEILPRLSSKIMLYQHEDLIKLIDQNDLMLTYGGTGAIHYGVLMKKPIVNLDFKINATGNKIFSHNKIITQCESPSNLISAIRQSKDMIISEEAVQQYIKKYIGILDGKSSRRVAEIIVKFLHERDS